jgi:hypothetical protein
MSGDSWRDRNPEIFVQGAYAIRPFWVPVFTGMTKGF